jgi:nucleoside-diphosphate-sugar epimerase
VTDARPYDPSVYLGVRVAVLGAGGFIGRWVARAVARAGAEPSLVVREADRARPVFDAMGIGGLPVEADLGEPGRAAEVLEEIRPAITFNLVGYGVDPAENDPETAERINTDLARSVADACAAVVAPGWPGQHLVHTGSALEYGTARGDLSEDTACTPTTEYGRTKLAGTLAVATVSSASNLASVTARLFTVYGPGEHHGRLLPSLLGVVDTGRPLDLTEGLQRRDFTFVEDVAEGLLRLGAAEPQPGTVVNLATGRLETVHAFAETAGRVLSIPPELLRFGARAGRPAEMEHDDVSVERLRRLTGWHPSTSIGDGIAMTAVYEEAMGRWPSG